MTEPEPLHLGHYLLGRTIGSGGFARVKEARHELTGARVAVKIINKSKMKNKNMISKVKREIKILKFINHPNIIKLYEVLDTTTDIFVVMEMAEGGELYNYIQNNDFTEEQVKQFFKQIINGVEAAHLHLVAHRDLKPENILLGPNNVLKIADFGLSNLMKDGKLLKTSCGSLNYAAPQIIGHRPYEGTSVDVWSCGVILYTMLVGALPFDEEVVSILYKKIQRAVFQIPEGVSGAARDLLRRMIVPNPCERLKIKDIKLHPWLRSQLPLYARLPTLVPTPSDRPFQLDRDVLATVRTYGMGSFINLHEEEERIKKTIQRRMDDSFVIAYELLRDQKEGGQIAQQMAKDSTPGKVIFDLVPNRLTRLARSGQDDSEKQFEYGRRFTQSARTIIQTVIEVFEKQGVSYTLKNNQYCLLCTYLTPHRGLQRRKGSRVSQQANYGSQSEERFSTHEINFVTQLYSCDREVVMDLRVVQGHPLLFLSFADSIYRAVATALEV